MIKFLKDFAKVKAIFFCVCAGIFLQGCDEERTTPFNPTLSSSSCSSSSSSSSSNSSSSSSSACSSSSSSSSSSTSSVNSSPSASSSSSSSQVTVSKLWTSSKAEPNIAIKGKSTQIIRDQNALNSAITAYFVAGNIPLQDFDHGQVVLIDDGEIDSCAQHLEFNGKITLEDTDADKLNVLVYYTAKPASDPAQCSSNITRPYSFYYIGTRKLITIVEKIE